jgi:TonB family protein
MYFEIEDSKPDIRPLGGPLTWRDGVFLSIIVHLLIVIAGLLGPKYFPFLAGPPKPVPAPQPERPREPTQFVFVQPKVDLKALKPPERAPASDIDRQATAPRRPENSTNPAPTIEGNTRQRVEQSTPEQARGPEVETPPSPQPVPEPPAPQVAENTPRIPETPTGIVPAPGTRTQPPSRPLAGSLGESLRNLQRYVQRDQFDNTQGGAAFGPAIQFDTKGVEFGPWIRRFIAQVKRNWEPLIPLSAMTSKGHVVVTFNVHKNGSISDLSVVGPSSVAAFNTAAYGALASSNPTAALPSEYPADKAFFTVTFFYNEEPPQ